MKIMVISDTHIKTDQLVPQFLMDIDKYDAIVHAGDFTSFEFYNLLESTGKLKAVHGNADEQKIKDLLPERLIFEADGVKIGIVHEGALSINDTTALRYLALEMEVDILIFGHFHRPLIEESDIILICPGSPTAPRMADPSFVEINIDDGYVSINILQAEGHCCNYLEFLKKLDSTEK